MSSSESPLGSIIDLLVALVERIPPTDPHMRRALRIGILTRRREQILARLDKKDNPADRAKLRGVEAELEALRSISTSDEARAEEARPGAEEAP